MDKIENQIMTAMRAEAIPAAEAGLWHIKKLNLAKPFVTKCSRGREHLVPAGVFTSLCRFTEKTLHLSLGELVMHDFPYELRKHLQFAKLAHGRVLITGLGLGCVARGCLANPAVKQVVVIENSPEVFGMVGPHMPQKRLDIIFADARKWTKENGDGFDCAWHDLWTEESDSSSDSNLQLQHMEMIVNLFGKVPIQGAWEFPRLMRRQLRADGII